MNQKMSLFTKISYGLGDFASQLIWTFVGTYLTVYYTDVVGLTPLAVSMIMLIARAYDAVDDPLTGAIAERTRTRFGRFRPYILYGTPLLAIVNVLAFTSPAFGGNQTAKVIWAGATYLLLGMLYSIVNLSYGALSTVMTNKPEEIIQLNSARMIGTNLGAILLSGAAMPLLLKFSNGDAPTARGYTMAVAVFSLLAIPLFYLLFFSSKEVIQPVKEEKIPFRTSFKVVLTNKPLICIFMIMLLSLIAIFGRLGTVIYYYIYVLKRFDLIAPLMMLPSICTVVSILVTSRFVEKVGKKKMCTISYIGSAAVLTALFFTDISNITMLMILTALFGIFSFSAPIPMSMIAEAIDYAEDKTGIRADGTSYATVSLSTKMASAIGGSIGIMMIGAFGYVANAEQTLQAMNGINLVVNLIPAAFMLLTLIPLYLYPLNQEKNEAIRNRLRAKEVTAREEIARDEVARGVAAREVTE